jgi:hypothetical protein
MFSGSHELFNGYSSRVKAIPGQGDEREGEQRSSDYPSSELGSIRYHYTRFILFIGKNEFSWIARQEKKFPHGFPVADLEFKITKVRLKDSCPKHLQGWDAVLLLTPYCDPNLTLLGRELRDGFRIDARQSSAK